MYTVISQFDNMHVTKIDQTLRNHINSNQLRNTLSLLEVNTQCTF